MPATSGRLPQAAQNIGMFCFPGSGPSGIPNFLPRPRDWYGSHLFNIRSASVGSKWSFY